MKQLTLVFGMSLFATVSFSQQVSGARDAIIKPIKNKEIFLQENNLDSITTETRMSREAKVVTHPISTKNQSNTEKATVNSSAKRKPD